MPAGSPFVDGPFGFVGPSHGARKIFAVTGQFLYASGAPVSGGRVDLFKADGTNTWVAWTTTDATGAYTFNPPTNGNYTAVCRLDGSPNYFGTTDYLVPS